MEAKYYKEYFKLEREHWYFRARNKIIMDFIRSTLQNYGDEISILNVGVGTGHTSELLQEFGAVKSIEYDEECCRFVRKKIDIEVINGSILELPFHENEFDLVCAFDVIEHVEEEKLAIKELNRVCKNEGFIVITVPAFMFLWSKHDEVNHHFRRYTKKRLLSLFNSDGKFVFHSYYNFWLFFPVVIFRFLNNLIGITKETKESTNSDFSIMAKDSLITKMLYHIFYSESFFITNNIALPFGISIITSWKKKEPHL